MNVRYQDLEANVKKSFQRSLTKSVNDILLFNHEHPMIFITEVTDEFMKEVFVDMRSKKYNQKWSEEELEFEDGELKHMVQKKVDALRNKKPTEKQLEYFKGMCKDINKDVDLPDDYLVFLNTMMKLKEEYNEKGPATERQIDAAKKKWKLAFDEELVIHDNITRKEIQEYFEKAQSIFKK
ncbi:hypothetical protein [Bacillus cereus group sp. TH152-1LC]|uniref:hypothetical protein n=1 Tax=Bacillus cereus group sp. TH152-1LC TaxID=3018060 RepID=UPI0022E6F2F0|nr:hypothetical protein [Bacillus cereus group sp. TH152-1LC]MDA1675607.1 hypothetical protein [Bacillus cereus group sp. TH152-1LC]